MSISQFINSIEKQMDDCSNNVSADVLAAYAKRPEAELAYETHEEDIPQQMIKNSEDIQQAKYLRLILEQQDSDQCPPILLC